jgi:hypothetical protein
MTVLSRPFLENALLKRKLRLLKLILFLSFLLDFCFASASTPRDDNRYFIMDVVDRSECEDF